MNRWLRWTIRALTFPFAIFFAIGWGLTWAFTSALDAIIEAWES